MAGALGPRQIFVKGRVRLREVKIGAFGQPKTKLVKERKRAIRPVCEQKDGFLEIVMQGSQQRQTDCTRQPQTAQVAANEIAFPDPV